MDLLNTIRKSGSRGGVNFSWDEVANSSHRQNYLGHSVKAPVGRWQQGKDLTWYAKAESSAGNDGETAEERQARERKEELRKIKEAEEDMMAQALGLPPPHRNTSGANAIEVDNKRRVGAADGETTVDDSASRERDGNRSHRHRERHRRDRRRHRSRSRSRSRSPSRRHDHERGHDHGRDRGRRYRSRDGNGSREQDMKNHDEPEERRHHRKRGYSRDGRSRHHIARKSERVSSRSRENRRQEQNSRDL